MVKFTPGMFSPKRSLEHLPPSPCAKYTARIFLEMVGWREIREIFSKFDSRIYNTKLSLLVELFSLYFQANVIPHWPTLLSKILIFLWQRKDFLFILCSFLLQQLYQHLILEFLVDCWFKNILVRCRAQKYRQGFVYWTIFWLNKMSKSKF